MLNQHLLILIIIGIVSIIVVGCSNSNEQDGNVTLNVALWDENVSKVVDESIKVFKEKHPNVDVKVTYTPYSDYFTRLRTSIAGKKGPDVFWMNGPNFYQYASLGLIKNVQPLMERDQMDPGVYNDALQELYSYEGDLYGLPYFQDTIGLFFNKKMFDEAGIDYPDESWTWETIEEVGKKLTDREKGIYGYIAPSTNQAGYYNLIHQAGGFVISEDKTESGFDSPQAREAFAWMKRLMQEGISPTAQKQAEVHVNQLFGSGKAAMLPNISVNAPTLYDMLGDDLGVAPLPRGKEKAAIVHGLSWVLNSHSQHEVLAWELMKTLSGEEAERMLAESGFSIPAYKGTEDAWIASIPELDLQVFVDSLEFGAPYPVSKSTLKWQNIESQEIQLMLFKDRSIDEATRNIAEKMNDILTEEQKK